MGPVPRDETCEAAMGGEFGHAGSMRGVLARARSGAHSRRWGDACQPVKYADNASQFSRPPGSKERHVRADVLNVQPCRARTAAGDFGRAHLVPVRARRFLRRSTPSFHCRAAISWLQDHAGVTPRLLSPGDDTQVRAARVVASNPQGDAARPPGLAGRRNQVRELGRKRRREHGIHATRIGLLVDLGERFGCTERNAGQHSVIEHMFDTMDG